PRAFKREPSRERRNEREKTEKNSAIVARSARTADGEASAMRPASRFEGRPPAAPRASSSGVRRRVGSGPARRDRLGVPARAENRSGPSARRFLAAHDLAPSDEDVLDAFGLGVEA